MAAASSEPVTFVLSEDMDGERLDSALAQVAPERSRSEWQRLISRGGVLVNQRPAKASQRVSAKDLVEVREPPRQDTSTPDDQVRFQVIYEDPSMLVIDKPPGLVVHPAPGAESGTLVNGLLARYTELRSLESDGRPGIVHRLDKDTSGLLVVGRTTAAVAALQEQMQARACEKRYLLLVIGNVGEDEGLIDAPIARDQRFRHRMTVRAGGRPARTRFFVRERFGDYTLVEALLITGRTHQLRVHFSSIGRPVAGDTTYGSGRGPAGLKRQFLHSHVLAIRSPYDQEVHTFVSPLPPDLEEPLVRLRTRRGAA